MSLKKTMTATVTGGVESPITCHPAGFQCSLRTDRSRSATSIGFALVSFVVISSCAPPVQGGPSDKLLAARYYLGGEVGLTPEQVERARRHLAERERLRQAGIDPDGHVQPSRSTTNAGSSFQAAPSDNKSHCSDPNSSFVQWIQSVQAIADNGGACLNARGAYLINIEAAKKSRFCSQFYTGTEREQSLRQAGEYDRVARQAQETIDGTCGE